MGGVNAFQLVASAQAMSDDLTTCIRRDASPFRNVGMGAIARSNLPPTVSRSNSYDECGSDELNGRGEGRVTTFVIKQGNSRALL